MLLRLQSAFTLIQTVHSVHMISLTSPMHMPAHRSTRVNLNNSDRDVHLLDRHPDVTKLFIKYYTAITSNAPVERLFQYTGTGA